MNTPNIPTQETYRDAVELASLVWVYFSGENFRELFEQDFKHIRKLKRWLAWLIDEKKEQVSITLDGKETIYKQEDKSELEKLIETQETAYKKKRADFEAHIHTYIDWKLREDTDTSTPQPLSHKDMEVMISEDLDIDALIEQITDMGTLERIRELYADPAVRDLYQTELKERQAGFHTLTEGKPWVIQILRIETIIKTLDDAILSLRTQARNKNRNLTPQESSKIKKFHSLITQQKDRKKELLSTQETASAYRLWELKSYKTQLEKWSFVNLPSRQDLIEQATNKLLRWENVILAWPTGTWKTVLAKKAIQTFLSKTSGGKPRKMEQISWEELLKDYKKHESDLAMVISGHSGMTDAELTVKPQLQWEISTTTQLWKLFQAWARGMIPIIDEIDLIPNDVLMRLKDVFTMNTGVWYSPQEDGDTYTKFHTTQVVWTANIKSEKHPNREDLDPAIIRVFQWIFVPYLTKSEAYDLALIQLMETPGYIYNISPEELQQDEIVYKLIKSLKQIEDNYLGKSDGLSINISGSEKSGIYLEKAILETGRFVSLFHGFQESGKTFQDFLTHQVLEFISNPLYPKNDKLILLKIFSQNGIITKSHVSLLADRMTDMSNSEITSNIMGGESIFTPGNTAFVDAYDLVNLDPYQERNLQDLKIWDIWKRQKYLIQRISQESLKHMDDPKWQEANSISTKILEEFNKDEQYQIRSEDISRLWEILWDMREIEIIQDFQDLWSHWQATYDTIKSQDTEWLFEKARKASTQETEILLETINLTEEYDEVWSFSEWYARVKQNGKSWFIDTNGKVLWDGIVYDDVWSFSEWYAKVRKWDKRWFIDTNGKVLWDGIIYDNVWSFSEWYAKVRKWDKCWFIDTNGKVLWKGIIYGSVWPFSEWYARVNKWNKWWFIDTNGKVLWKGIVYDYVWSFSEGYAAVNKWNKWWFIDTKGKVLWKGIVYDDVWSFSEGYARVKQNGKWWFIDTNGKVLWDGIVYDDVWSFSEWYAGVNKWGKSWFIDTNGDELWDGIVYDIVWSFSEGYARVKQNGKWWFIDTNGDELWDGIVYDIVYDFSEGYARVKQNGKWWFIDTNGKVLWEGLVYDYALSFSEGYAWAKKDGKWLILKKVIRSAPNTLNEQLTLKNYISQKRAAIIEEYRDHQTVTTNGATLSVTLTDADKQRVLDLSPDNIHITSSKTIEIQGETLSLTELTIEDTDFVAIQVPEFLKGKQLRDTYIGAQLANNSNFPKDFLDQTLTDEYIVYGKTSAKDASGKTRVKIPAYDTDSKTDVVRDCLKQWFHSSNIVYEVILWELMKNHSELWEEYVNYEWYKADKDQKWYEEKEEYLKKIRDIFGIDFNDYVNKTCVTHDYGVYKNAGGDIYGFIRGGTLSHGAIGGPVSLGLPLSSLYNSVNISFRPSV